MFDPSLTSGDYFDHLAHIHALSRKAKRLRISYLRRYWKGFMKSRRKVGIPYSVPQPQCFADLWLMLHDGWSTRVMLQEDPQGFYQEYFRLKAECNVEIRKLKGGAYAH